MKRKLLSLTLVLALVLSLVPMGAFAADGDAAAATSIVSVDKTSITADYNAGTGSAAEFTVYARKSDNTNAASEKLYVVSSRVGVDVVTNSALATPQTVPQVLTADANGKLVFKVMTPVAGTFKIGVFTKNPLDLGTAQAYINVLNGTSTPELNATTLGLIATKELTAVSGSYDNLTEDSISGTGVKANGIDKYEWQVILKGANNAPVAGEKITFTTSNSAVTLSASEIVTNAAGLAKVKVYSTKPGTFTVEARIGDKVVEKSLTFAATGAYSMEYLDDQDQKIAKDTDNQEFTFKIYDMQNNVITPAADASGLGLTATVEDEPSSSSLKDPVLYASPADKEVYLKLAETLKVEGNYVVRLALENGKKIDVKFSVVKQGTITDLEYTYKESTVAYGAKTNAPTLKRIDAAGVKKSVTLPDTSNIYFTSSDATVATVGTDGKVQFADDKDNVGKKVTVTVTDKSKNLSKSFELTVGGKIAAIKAEAPATAQVGKDAAVKVSVVDNKGNVVAGYDNVTVENTVVINKPAGVIVSHEAVSTFTADIKKRGYATVNVNSNKEGVVKLQVILKDANNVRFSTIVDVNFGAQAVVASKSVVLTIGSKTGFNNNNPVTSDLAPFIQDGRTFVPVSFIAAQLGGTAEFTKNAAGLVDTVTVKVGNTTVVLTIGSTTIKVVKDGKESTVTTDVAPFIKSGRTVLPFRAVAEAFGAKVSFGPETGAVEWVKFEM